MTHHIVIDAIGLLCPLPVLKARKALAGMPEGAVLCLLASDPAAIVDVPHFCAESGHVYLGQSPASDHVVYQIRKGPSRPGAV